MVEVKNILEVKRIELSKKNKELNDLHDMLQKEESSIDTLQEDLEKKRARKASTYSGQGSLHSKA